jgi:hypothetical protein
MSDAEEPTEEAPEPEENRAPEKRATEPINELHGPPRGARGIAQHERAREMVQLRVAFVPVAEVAERYGISPGRVRAIVARELKQNRQKSAAEYRDVFAAQYDALARPYLRDAFGWTERHPEGHPQAGEVARVHPPDLKKAEFVLKCVNESRRLQGLDKLTIVDEILTPEERAGGIVGQLRAYMQGIEDAKAEAEETNGQAAANGESG